MSDTFDFTTLSKRARAIAGIKFGMMPVGRGSLTFEMQQSKPSPEMQEVLDELVTAKVISREDNKRSGAVIYRPLVDCYENFAWVQENIDDPELRFPVTVPINRD